MKKILLAAGALAFLLPGVALAVSDAYNTVTLTSSARLSVNSIEVDVTSTGSTGVIASTTVSNTSFTVSLAPNSTIKLQAPSRNVLTVTNGAGYIPDIVCNDSQSTLTLAADAFSATTTVTVTPSTSICSSQVSGGSTATVAGPTGGGGGGGGVTVVATPITMNTPASTGATSISALQAQLNALLAQIAALTGGAMGGSTSFTKNLQVGSTGADVKSLQMYLNAHGFSIAKSGAGSSGNETTKFGGLTKAALAKWQASVGISPAVGYFGPLTRAYIAAHP